MKNKREAIRGIWAGCAILILILDTKTALSGAVTGLQLCLNVIIPSLFPFVFLSGILNCFLLGKKSVILTPLNRLCKIPRGSESLLLLGFLGGYPVGAQAIAQAYQERQLSAIAAKRMLGFCNNAGPAFLFGMFSVIFSRPLVPWILWTVHIFSALMVGFLLPGEQALICQIGKPQPITIHKALQNALKVISVICGWVILFRIIISFCYKWFLWLLPVETQVLLSGFLELSNGCVMLRQVPEESIRFLLACPMLAFGGICVGMQTASVTAELGSGYYFPGKVLQALFSLLFAILLYPLIFSNGVFPHTVYIVIILITAIGIILYGLRGKKLWHLQKKCCIIPVSVRRREQIYAVSKKNNTIL